MERWAGELVRATAGRRPEDVLAGLAAAAGVHWDGPGRPMVLDAPPDPVWHALDLAREALLARADRRRLGAHHTPPELARRLVALALDGLGPDAVVVDPACGGGAFLVTAAEALTAAGADPASVVDRQLAGVDLDPLAAATTRAALHAWARQHGADHVTPLVVVADGLAAPWPAADVVVGNPPFLSPLGSTTGGTAAAEAMRRALGAPYADVALLFLLRAMEQVRPGGRVVLLQPESVLTARDARPVRDALVERLDGLWVAGEPVFAASVRVCAPVLVHGTTGRRVRRWTGRSVRALPSAARPERGASWASLRPTSAPAVARVPSGGVVGDLAVATAGFRDEFYGIAAAVGEGGSGHPVVTSGLIDPGRLAWGERPARIAGCRYTRPMVDFRRLGGPVAAWVAARLVPKVLVATQTRVVEAAPDPGGLYVPLTPVLSVTPHDPADVWRLAAALTSPVVTAWALHTTGGAARSGDAVKLSARQVLDAPLPADVAAWAEATAALAAGDVESCARALAGRHRRLFTWWQARVPAGRP